MTQPNQNLTHLVKNYDGTRNSKYPTGNKPQSGSISISGTNLGSPPPVVLYTDWSDASLGAMSLTNGGVGPDYLVSERLPNILSAFGRNGVGMHEGGTNYATNNRNTSVVAQFTPKKNFSISTSIAVPSGRHFPAASAPNQLPSPISSALKVLWLFDQPPDSPTKADIVLPSWIGDSLNLLGNNTPINIYGGNLFDFTGWNYFKGKVIAGANAFVSPAQSLLELANAVNGVSVDTDNTTPAFGNGADTAQYDRVVVGGWTGANNGNSMDMAQVLINYIYLAMADDDTVNAEVELRNHATRSSATELRLIPPTIWTSTNIAVTVPAYMMYLGFTHYRVTTQTGQVFDGAITI